MVSKQKKAKLKTVLCVSDKRGRLYEMIVEANLQNMHVKWKIQTYGRQVYIESINQSVFLSTLSVEETFSGLVTHNVYLLSDIIIFLFKMH